NPDKSGKSPLQLACERKQTALLGHLWATNHLSQSDFDAEVRAGHAETVKMLLATRGDRDKQHALLGYAKGEEKPSALHSATGYPEVVKALLEAFGQDDDARRAYVNQKDVRPTGVKSALDLAREQKHAETVRLLERALGKK